ncbi:MAG TPA: transposase [Anaerolineae bacterium]|nr:transposase [Anaerolineae bacterium]
MSMPWTKPYQPPKNQRLDPALYADVDRVVFITIRAYQDLTPFNEADRNAAILDCLKEEQARNHCCIFTYCLMPDHLHYLISPEQNGSSVLRFTDQFKGKATNLSWKLGWRGKLWQPCCFDHVVRAEEDLRAIAQYILDNPVRKGLIERAEDWRWSGHFNPLPL